RIDESAHGQGAAAALVARAAEADLTPAARLTAEERLAAPCRDAPAALAADDVAIGVDAAGLAFGATSPGRTAAVDAALALRAPVRLPRTGPRVGPAAVDVERAVAFAAVVRRRGR